MTTKHLALSHTRGVEAPVGKAERLSMQDIEALVKRTTADIKEDLPMLIGGTFDETRRRANDNMLSVTWIMGDYDLGEMTPQEAALKLRDAKVTGLIYTSPRHELDGMKSNGQRWRVMCPLAEPVSLPEHAALARRLNGVFGQDVLGTEGKSASRPYYYGHLDGRPECQTFIVEGDGCRFIDQVSKVPELKFPQSAHEHMVFPVLSDDADAEEIGRVVLKAAAKFTGGHEGLRPACMMIAPFVRLSAIDPEEVAEALQEQLLATSSRRPEDLPDGEAMRTLKWATYSDNVTAAVEHLETAIQLDELDVTTAVRKLAVRYTDASDDFEYAEPLPPEDDIPTFQGKDLDAGALAAALNLSAWRTKDIPSKKQYLGDLVASSTPIFLVGATGLGKSQLAYAMAVGIASGAGFLHWKGNGQAGRVLIFDGEMSSRVIKGRLADAVRRSTVPMDDANILLVSLDEADDLVKRFPAIGKPAPLNTDAGRAWCQRIMRAVNPDVVFFDNVMSLTSGDQTTETPWSETLPLVAWITSTGRSQVWLDHTGNARERQYGSSTKRWRMSAVGIMTNDGETQSPDRLAFKLSFAAPHGKSRERCRDNWTDFQDVSIALENDKWEWKADDIAAGRLLSWLDALRIGLTTSGKDSLTNAEWLAYAKETMPGGGITTEALRTAKRRLKDKGLIVNTQDMSSRPTTDDDRDTGDQEAGIEGII